MNDLLQYLTHGLSVGLQSVNHSDCIIVVLYCGGIHTCNKGFVFYVSGVLGYHSNMHYVIMNTCNIITIITVIIIIDSNRLKAALVNVYY